ncbi:hypothetical protein EPUS_07006 [Endocarpon pusillum Z07020]|uniref:Uncharacterized protein n=1 Tax=Endocarpon pusillum (strain Z07020 / HMAS-L-300199) TaxID=1263415 RepID=U1I0R9_ENDPU|nr:uncharacterized protein EPUS_07006 [Endocarpon pusillum Z07020]ERF75474.1 hypothetical protein EPUS_07006 [Endocarpon pusillum Z07020]
MTSRKEGFASRSLDEITCKTGLCTGWVAHDDQVAYEVHSQQGVDKQLQNPSTLNTDNGVAARRQRQFQSGNPRPERQQPSLVTHRSSCSLSEDALPMKMLIPACRHFNEHMRTALRYAVPHPPVTTTTLVELDLNWILHNMNLRSDINFEPDLHFMPVGGKRAERKRREAQEYWLALAAELQIHLHTRMDCPPLHHNQVAYAHDDFSPRLGQMLTDLRELLETLVPDKDHISIAENLDVAFLMQQVENGVLDISRFAKWLSALLKSHCAPIRDAWADSMAQQIDEGAQKSDMILLVRGIEKLFSVLEAMKLDVANHQIRTFRFQLMEDTIPFQQDFFAKRIMDGKVGPELCRDWYDRARQRHLSWSSSFGTPMNEDAYASLIYGLIASFSSVPSTSALPKSFLYDLERLEQLRIDTHDLGHLRMCLIVFDELHSWLGSGRPTSVSSKVYTQLQSRILAIVDEQTEVGDPWQISSASVALEITRAAYEFCGHSQVVVPDCLIQSTLCRMNDLVSGHTSQGMFIWESLQEDLTFKAIHHAQIFNDMTPLAVSNAQQQWQQRREQQTSFRPLPEVEDVARRVAHVGILHWKIWANLVYLDDGEVASSELGSLVDSLTESQPGDRATVLTNVMNPVAMVVE